MELCSKLTKSANNIQLLDSYDDSDHNSDHDSENDSRNFSGVVTTLEIVSRTGEIKPSY
jgi:hypothetical protein